MKKLILSVSIALATIGLASAQTTYFTKSATATLQGGEGNSTGWYTSEALAQSNNAANAVSINAGKTSSFDNFVVLAGGSVTISGNTVNIGDFELRGGAATKLNVNKMNASQYFNVKGKLSGSFERTGAGTMYLTGGNDQEMQFTETSGSSLTGTIALAGGNVKLAGDVLTFGIINLTNSGDLYLNGKTLTAHRIITNENGVLVGDQNATIVINTYNNETVGKSLSSTLFFDQTANGKSNRLKALAFQKDITNIEGAHLEGTSKYYNYLNLRNSLTVGDLVFGPSTQDSQLSLNDAVVPVLTIEGSFYSTSAGNIQSPGINVANGSVVFAPTSTLKLRDQNQKLFYNYGMSAANLTIKKGAKLQLVAAPGVSVGGNYQLLKTKDTPAPVIEGVFNTVIIPGFSGKTIVKDVAGGKELVLTVENAK